MKTVATPTPRSVQINVAHQFSLGYHFLALSFTTTTLVMGVLIGGGESLFLGMLGLFFVGVNQMLSALVGGLQYGRGWQIAHLLAATCFIGVQVALISIFDGLLPRPLPGFVITAWLVANVLISLAAGWSYWFNLRSSYVREGLRKQLIDPADSTFL